MWYNRVINLGREGQCGRVCVAGAGGGVIGGV